MIDLMVDLGGETEIQTSLAFQILGTLLTSFLVAFLTARFARSSNTLKRMMQLLIWSTLFVATLKLITQVTWEEIATATPALLVSKVFFVYLVFFTAAVYCTWFTVRKID